MKIYYVENKVGRNEVEQFYLIDFEFGFLAEYNLEGAKMNWFDDWDDFFQCWDTRKSAFSIGHCPIRGRAQFSKFAVIERVA